MTIKSHNQHGFTLIEAMITVVIIGILASIAYPSYTQFVAKGARSDALAALMNASNRQEQYYLDHKTYTNNMRRLGLNAPTNNKTHEVENGLYEVKATTANSSRFVLVAAAIGVQKTRDDACKEIQLDSDGVKSPAACWAN
ncbi:prepilin-type N-terminal cleavage/methylation domain-containing protein [Shewanella sp. WXL01]|uniref:Prepilin-type N-terminal cleavage/methylation domain-containing protein n=1 Tax=Shewanella maritima TaxID=2520507 RepID=A0A411PKD2_9GAMM|nr:MULTISPECIES: type IV pilin protein [Shewanella]NKF51001.1 prepilin-type N-terminal cleavage/methylation domain-containing protein [Shewanella sp. WXL01]QBF83962.1 prepilin-type N-terminal cleavage/methylation domain-containing protein [Shewanella maritima]